MQLKIRLLLVASWHNAAGRGSSISVFGRHVANVCTAYEQHVPVTEVPGSVQVLLFVKNAKDKKNDKGHVKRGILSEWSRWEAENLITDRDFRTFTPAIKKSVLQDL